MSIIINLISGLCLFLFGLSLIRCGLQMYIGKNIEKILNLVNKNIFFCVLAGFLITLIVQSSNATIVMIVGLVNTGVLGLLQAFGVILGSNIGTSFTVQLISFNLNSIASISLMVGMVFYLFPPNANYKLLSNAFLGFGLLFFGMDIMTNSIHTLSGFKYFRDILYFFDSKPALNFLTGFLLTGIIQSSSASIALLMALCSSELLSFNSAVFAIYGINIGTCITPLFSSFGANRNSKRTSLMHLIFNLTGSIVFILFLNNYLTYLVMQVNPYDISRQIANAHTLFNMINVTLLLPFSKYIVTTTKKIIPYDSIEDSFISTTKYLDERLLQVPSLALYNTIHEVSRIGDKTSCTLNNGLKNLLSPDSNSIYQSSAHIKNTYKIQQDTFNYLFSISVCNLNEDERNKTIILSSTVNDLKKICTYNQNIIQLIDSSMMSQVDLYDIDKTELINLYNNVISNFDNSIKALKDNDTRLANNVLASKKEVYYFEKSSREYYINCLSEENCNIDIGVIYLNIISNLEKISIHSVSIAEQVIRLR